MMRVPVTEAELHAYVDGLLTEIRRDEVENYLRLHADEAQRVRAWIEQKKGLHGLYDPVLTEPLPTGVRKSVLLRRIQPLLRYASVVMWFALGGVGGWYVHDYNASKSTDAI